MQKAFFLPFAVSHSDEKKSWLPVEQSWVEKIRKLCGRNVLQYSVRVGVAIGQKSISDNPFVWSDRWFQVWSVCSKNTQRWVRHWCVPIPSCVRSRSWLQVWIDAHNTNMWKCVCQCASRDEICSLCNLCSPRLSCSIKALECWSANATINKLILFFWRRSPWEA